MNTPLISIIVPVYNAEAYLNRCIDSILEQSIQDFEVILVNDGSKDSSEAICKEYASQDNRIRVFSKPNGGVSSARNLGLDNASGEYIMFVDADDWLDKDAIERCYPYLPEYDMVKFGAKNHWGDGTISNLPVENTTTLQEVQSTAVARNTIVAPWGMLIRKSFFDEHSIRFDSNLVLGEDWLVYGQLVFYIKTFKFLPEHLAYNYNRYNDSSCTNNLTLEKLIDQYYVIEKLKQLYGNNYAEDFRYIKVIILRAILNIVKRKKTVQWLSKEDNIADKITFRDIVSAKGIKLSTKRRLFKLLCQVYILKKTSIYIAI